MIHGQVELRQSGGRPEGPSNGRREGHVSRAGRSQEVGEEKKGRGAGPSIAWPLPEGPGAAGVVPATWCKISPAAVEGEREGRRQAHEARLLLASEQLHVHCPPEKVGAAVGEERGGAREDIIVFFICLIIRMVLCRPILLMRRMTCCHASCHITPHGVQIGSASNFSGYPTDICGRSKREMGLLGEGWV